MKNTHILLGVVLLLLFAAGCEEKQVQKEITSFDECVAAGYPVMESYPAKCSVPGGQTFVDRAADAIVPYRLVEVTDDTCTVDSDCETPQEYLVRSDCPYQSICVDGKCSVVCPEGVPVQPPVVGGDRDEHGCIPSAGYTWCEESQKCIRPWEEACANSAVPEMTKELCDSSNGHWTDCGSKCQIDNQGKEGVACTMMCEQLCECGGIAGFGCPADYRCTMPEGIADAMGYCEPKKGSMTAEEARAIAETSDCIKEGKLQEGFVYNEFTRTYWFDMDVEKEGCAPACVVSESTKSAEINWRCTGALI